MPDPSGASQKMDLILFLFYLGMPFSFNNAPIFISLCLSMFVLATIKYILLLKHYRQFRASLIEKIRANCLGIGLLLIALAGVFAGYAPSTLRALVLAYATASVYYLLINPNYLKETGQYDA